MSTFKDDRRKHHRWRYTFMKNGMRYSGSAPLGDNTQRAAAFEERAHLERLRDGITIKTQPTMIEFAAKFLEYQATQFKPLTIEGQTVHVDQHILPTLGRLRLDAIDTRHFDQLKVAWTKAGAAPRTINVRLGTLARMLALAVEWKYLRHAPTFKAVKVPKDTPRYLDEDEANRLLTHALPEWHEMILIGLRTGMRIGELRGLQWGDIDVRTRSVQVRRTDPGRPDLPPNGPKGGRERTIPLTPDAFDALQRIRPDGAARDAWVWQAMFLRRRAGELVRAARGSDVMRARSSSGCFHAIRYAVEHAKLKEPTKDDAIAWHTLRHTFASWLVLRGELLTTVQSLLGHASIKQTERYAHLAPNLSHHSAVAKLDLALIRTKQPKLGEAGSGPGSDGDTGEDRE